MSEIIVTLRIGKNTVLVDKHPVPYWKDPLQEMAELHNHLEADKIAGKITGYSTELRKERKDAKAYGYQTAHGVSEPGT